MEISENKYIKNTSVFECSQFFKTLAKCHAQTSASALPWEIDRNADSQVPSQTYSVRLKGQGASSLF